MATNDLDGVAFPAEAVLSEYKQQILPERGFRFLKDPQFFADSVFVKNPERVAAIALIMALALLVYRIGERYLRQQLQAQQQTIPSQTGKPTHHPTLRWVFQFFYGVHRVVLASGVAISNLTEDRRHVLQFFPEACQLYYAYASSFNSS